MPSKEQIEFIVLGVLESAIAHAMEKPTNYAWFQATLEGRRTDEQYDILDHMWTLAQKDPEIFEWSFRTK